MSSDQQTQTERIIIPSKYKCEKHVYYSDTTPCPDCFSTKKVTVSQIADAPNVMMAAIIDDQGRMQMVINSTNEGNLWATWKRLEQAIGFVLQKEEIRRQATAVQAVPASVLEKMRGNE